MANYTPPGSIARETSTQAFSEDSSFPPPPPEVQDPQRNSSYDSYSGVSPYPDVTPQNSHRSSDDDRIRRGPSRINHVPSLRMTDDDNQSSG